MKKALLVIVLATMISGCSSMRVGNNERCHEYCRNPEKIFWIDYNQLTRGAECEKLVDYYKNRHQ